MTIRELKSRITNDEVMDWMKFYERHPFGPEIDAYYASRIAGSMGAKDVMLGDQSDSREMTSDQMLAEMTAVFGPPGKRTTNGRNVSK